MHALVAAVFLITFAAAENARCNPADTLVYADKGSTFKSAFRSLGGFTVSKSAYIRAVSNLVGLSAQCASCYGDAYICGWHSCLTDCMRESPKCDTCLAEHRCSQDCDACTGFVAK